MYCAPRGAPPDYARVGAIVHGGSSIVSPTSQQSVISSTLLAPSHFVRELRTPSPDVRVLFSATRTAQ